MDYRERYAQWLNEFKYDAETIAELAAIENDPREIEDRFYRELAFGTAGMRGVLGAGANRMNAYNVRRATRALATHILSVEGGASRGVVIAYDSRIKSDEFALQAALTLANAGVNAMLFDALRPVPLLSYSVRKLHAIAGIVITASHNPKEFNGYKVYWEDGAQISPELADIITKLISETSYEVSQPMDEAQALETGRLRYLSTEMDDQYLQAVRSLCVNPALAEFMGAELKIVYTPLHGAGNILVRRILDMIGMKNVYVVAEQEKPDGSFPTVRVPNPEDKGAFTLAAELQEKLSADLCIATDPDCDRVGVACLVDGAPVLLNGNQIGVLLLHYILSQKAERGELPENAAAVKSIVSTEMARRVTDDYGAALIDVLTGFKFIGEQIQRFEDTGEHTFMFGFEESFGYLSGTEVRDKDGVNACMLIAEAAAYYKSRGMTLIDAMEALYRKYGYFGEAVSSYAFAGADGARHMSDIMRKLRENPPEAFGESVVINVRDYLAGIGDMPKSDVLYYELAGGGWACIRPSGTEPKIKLYLNAVSDSRNRTDELLSGYARTADGIFKMEDSV